MGLIFGQEEKYFGDILESQERRLSPGGGPLWSPMGSQFDLFLLYFDGGGGVEEVF